MGIQYVQWQRRGDHVVQVEVLIHILKPKEFRFLDKGLKCEETL